MIKTKRRREREDPPKDTLFALRGRVVDPKDITRFEKRAIKKGQITADETLSDQGKLRCVLQTSQSLTETCRSRIPTRQPHAFRLARILLRWLA